MASCYNWREMEMEELRVQSAPTEPQLKGHRGFKESEGAPLVNLSVSRDNGGGKVCRL